MSYAQLEVDQDSLKQEAQAFGEQVSNVAWVEWIVSCDEKVLLAMANNGMQVTPHDLEIRMKELLNEVKDAVPGNSNKVIGKLLGKGVFW